MAPRKANAKLAGLSKNTKKNKLVKQVPPFPLYDDVDKASFDQGWASVVAMLKGRKNIAVLTGAGISVSCGIPDFRSKDKGTCFFHESIFGSLLLTTSDDR
jgi:hypothetical protein